MRAFALPLIGSIAVGLGSSALADDADDKGFAIIASAATAQIAAGPTGRRTLRLPALDFRFQFRLACPGATQPLSLGVTIADTHRSLGAEDLESEVGVAQTTIRIPSGQIAPVAVEGFCAAGDVPNDARPLTLPALLSASASLRCGADETSFMQYSSVPLDVVLVCEPREPPETGANPNQATSAR